LLTIVCLSHAEDVAILAVRGISNDYGAALEIEAPQAAIELAKRFEGFQAALGQCTIGSPATGDRK